MASSSLSFTTVGVIGAGAWGTALAQSVQTGGRDVLLWAREAELVDTLNTAHENTLYLPGVALDPALRATASFEALRQADVLLVVAPTQHVRAVISAFDASGANRGQPLVLCDKGIEQKTLALPSSILAEVAPKNPIAILSGPTFAAEVARGLPTAVTLAAADPTLGRALAEAIGSRTLRPYLSDDIIGTQIGGAIKNVIAIACGIAYGCRLGDNARAALITRGLAEMVRLGLALGGKRETLMGLSGMGDLVLTCSSLQSRNMSLGAALGEGKDLASILAGRTSVAEGVWTSSAAIALATQHAIDMPIAAAVDAILNRGASVADTIQTLLARPWKTESL
jgi:glycerol-3-phosphate dehydrogenase (NAD(P)+)